METDRKGTQLPPSLECSAKPTCKLDLITVIGERDGFLDARVPLELIYEDVAVDKAHVDELAQDFLAQIAVGRHEGQTIPVYIGFIPDENRLLILDGFHRCPARRKIGKTDVIARVDPNVTWEDIYRQRLIATTHESVRFSRTAQWLSGYWNTTEWSKEGISVNRAFGISDEGSRPIPEDKKDDIEKWVNETLTLTGKPKSTIVGILRTAEKIAPDLINQTRVGVGNKDGVLTKSHLEALVAILPYDHDRQRIVVRRGLELNLKPTSMAAMALVVKDADTLEVAEKIVLDGWRERRKEMEEERIRFLRGEETSRSQEEISPEDPELSIVGKIGHQTKTAEELFTRERHQDGDLLEKYLRTELRMTHLLMENAVLKGRLKPSSVPPSLVSNDVVPASLKLEYMEMIFAGIISGEDSPDIDSSKISIPNSWSKSQEERFMEDAEFRRFEMIKEFQKRHPGLPKEDAEELLENAALRMIGATRELITQALPKLPEKVKRVLLLHVFYDLSIEDTARVAEINTGTSAEIIGKLKNSLFKELRPGCDFRNLHYFKRMKEIRDEFDE